MLHSCEVAGYQDSKCRSHLLTLLGWFASRGNHHIICIWEAQAWHTLHVQTMRWVLGSAIHARNYEFNIVGGFNPCEKIVEWGNFMCINIYIYIYMCVNSYIDLHMWLYHICVWVFMYWNVSVVWYQHRNSEFLLVRLVIRNVRLQDSESLEPGMPQTIGP